MNPHLSVLCILLSVQHVRSQLQPTRACGIQIIADKFLWDQFLSEVEVQDETEKERIARYELSTLAGRLVNTANKVLQNQYLGKLKYKLLLQEVQILDTEEKCGELCEEDLDLEDLLNTYAYSPRDSHCLSYLLTYRSFKNGKLGLAFTASSFHGGVCETYRNQKEELFGYEREIKKSLNTGVVTLNRNGRRVSEQVASLTFSHEIGHSFGAPHDPEECYGEAEHGTFLMYKSGSLGKKRNNMQLSPCSVKSMSAVLASLDLRESGTCWTLDTGHGTCGNSIVEVWEECDCGSDPVECDKQCCVPPGDKFGRKPCKLTKGAQCSPSEGLCCNRQCQYSPSTVSCTKKDDCTKEAFCTGKNSYCPLPRPVEDNLPCAGGSKTCQKGQCSGSVCQSLGMLPCVPETQDDATDCRPHCHTPHIPCTPVNYSYPDGVECILGDLYGYCGGGACLLSGGGAAPTWMVGVAIFVVFYCIFVAVGLWLYCRYCRPSTVTLLPVKGSSEPTHSGQTTPTNLNGDRK